MSRIELKFAELAKKNQKALVAYVMVGYPDDKSTIKVIQGLVKGGVDIIELGFPFSDPMADGPVIQNAATISLNNGTKLTKFFALISEIRRYTDIPLIIMTYTNILYHQNYEKFISKAKRAGIDGIILPDMSVEESSDYLKYARDIDSIFLASPNTSKERFQKLIKISSGFLYLVAVYGTTGSQSKINNYTIRAIKKAQSFSKGKLPIGVGFGISTPDDVKNYIKHGADAVIVGSAFLNLIKDTPYNKLEGVIESFTKSLKKETIL